jgi:hypothetical protein
MAIRHRKTPEPMTMEEFGLLDALEDQLLDWMGANKGPWVATKADHPNVSDVVWRELARSAGNTGWKVIVTDTTIAIEAQGPEA